MINGFFRAYGYKSGENLLSFTSLFNLTAAMLLIALFLALCSIFKKKENNPEGRLLALTFVGAVLCFILFYGFSDLNYLDRYLIPVFLLPLPILIQYNDSLIKERELWLKAAAILFCVLFTICGIKNYQDATLDLTEEKRKVTAAVMEHDCRYGYASFWNGNVLTELSEGKIEVHVWGDNISEIEEINQTYQWLQIKSHESEAPEGKVFCLFDYEQFSCPLASKMDPGKLIYQSEEYKLYLYDSYDQLNQTVSDKWR